MKKRIARKILIVRFSSFGDIVQCMGVIPSLKRASPRSEIHWIVRREYAPILRLETGIDRIWPFDPASGIKGLLDLFSRLKRENFDSVYDAHCNLRSTLLKLCLPFFTKKSLIVTRKKNRIKRFLLFKLRIDLFPKPFLGTPSYLYPLAKWGISLEILPAHWTFPPSSLDKIEEIFTGLSSKPIITIIPSCAWPMKRWPLSYWKELTMRLDRCHFVVLGGPKDSFCEEIASLNPSRIVNLAGKLSLVESCAVIAKSRLFVAADTGLLHVGDLLNKNGIALLGPTAFGRPSRSKIAVMETSLSCRPCTKDGRGRCSQKIYQKCLVDITPKQVAERILHALETHV